MPSISKSRSSPPISVARGGKAQRPLNMLHKASVKPFDNIGSTMLGTLENI